MWTRNKFTQHGYGMYRIVQTYFSFSHFTMGVWDECQILNQILRQILVNTNVCRLLNNTSNSTYTILVVGWTTNCLLRLAIGDHDDWHFKWKNQTWDAKVISNQYKDSFSFSRMLERASQLYYLYLLNCVIFLNAYTGRKPIHFNHPLHLVHCVSRWENA